MQRWKRFSTSSVDKATQPLLACLLASSPLSLLIRRIGQTQIRRPSNTDGTDKGNLKLDRHGPEIQDLHRRPDHIIRPQRREVDILELLHYRSSSSALGDGHEGEEDAEADGGEDELVHCHALEGGDGAAGFCEWEGAGEEAEPFELDGGHEETVGHEAG